MRLPRSVRLLGLLTVCILLYLGYLTFKAPSPVPQPRKPAKEKSPSHSSTREFVDPNSELIDEPPGPLHRVNGDNYDPSNQSSNRIPATLMSLVRNSELVPLLQSIRDLERTFNHKFNYPWTFFNDEPFSPKFKRAVVKATNAQVSFHTIPAEHWATPPWINSQLVTESAKVLAENGVQYADKPSYHRMCRWNSGLFPHHPALAEMQYYWRVEPNVHFFCDIDYDVFRYMDDHNKTYGFTVNLYDAPESIPGLWPAVQSFLADPSNEAMVHPNSALPWLTDSKHRPQHNKKANGYSTCHFWSNFEIAALKFWRSSAYTKFFQHLDRAGGFFYERWGDAPVHSIALGLLEDKDKIHWFRDIGYQHIPFFNCPTRPPGKCKGCKEGLFTDGEKFLYDEDCRPSWLEHVGLGEWGESSKSTIATGFKDKEVASQSEQPEKVKGDG